MKNRVLWVLVPLFWIVNQCPVGAAAEDYTQQLGEIKKIHDRSAAHFSIAYNGVNSRIFPLNPDILDKFVEYRKRATEGRLPDHVTLDEVETWYKALAEPQRTFSQTLKYWIRGRDLRSSIHAPRMTWYPFEEHREAIINTTQHSYFRITHSSKVIDLLPMSDQTVEQENAEINPGELYWPLAFLDDLQQVQVKPAGQFLEISWFNTADPHAFRGNEIASLQAWLDPENHYLSQKTLIQKYGNSEIHLWTYSEQEQITERDGLPIPQTTKVLKFKQYDPQAADQPADSFQGVSSDTELNLSKLDFDTFKDYYVRLIMETIPELVSSQPLVDSVFWPSAPEAYKFQDYRYFFHYNYDWISKKNQEKVEEFMIGYGPHEFPLTIEKNVVNNLHESQ